MILGLYRTASWLATPLVTLLIARRAAAGKEDAARLGERRGHAGAARPDGRLIWIHAASVGESLSILPLAEKLLEDDETLHIVVTTGTVTSAALLERRLPPRIRHQFAPVDTPGAVSRFLDHWRPDAAFWVESELWPNLVSMTQARGIPMVLVNGRMSERSFARWRRADRLARRLLSGFALGLGQTPEDAMRLRELGLADARHVADLKAAAAPPPVDEDELERLVRGIAERPVWIAASTHDGDEALAGRLHEKLETRLRNPLTVIVPRHPARGPAIAEALRRRGLTVARRGANEALTPETDVFLGDTMGEMGLYLGLGQIVFIGKSLLHDGGHNPREPARLGRAILHGPAMTNFSHATRRLDEAGGALAVRDEAALTAAVAALLADPDRAAAMGETARRVAEGEARGVIEAHVEALSAVLPR